MAGHVARMGEERGAYRVLVGKPEGKRPQIFINPYLTNVENRVSS